jgi:hypothetical protein
MLGFYIKGRDKDGNVKLHYVPSITNPAQIFGG